MPHLRNPNFTGREELLENLRTALTSGKHTALTQQAIAGMGGVGKTQLAIEYSYRYMADYDLIWWVRSEEPATLASDYARLAQPLDLPQKDATEQPVIVEAVRDWLGRNGGWLLIFDNAPGPDELRDYLPRAPTGHVIITSRNPNWGDVAGSLQVDVWLREESIAFLLKRTGQTDKETANKLAEELGDLPLALEQAAAYITETGNNLSGYLDLFRSRCKELWKQEHCPQGYEYTVATTWTVSMDKVREQSHAAADLLNLCAFLAPDEIPKKLLTQGKEHLPRRLAKAVADPLKFDAAIASLRRYSLIQADEDSLTVHRLVQAVTRDRLAPNSARQWAEGAIRLTNGAFPCEPGLSPTDFRSWQQCAALLSHALAASRHTENLEAGLEQAGHLLNQAGVYLQSRADFPPAKTAYERSLAIAEAAFGANDPRLATVANNLGSVLEALGDLKGARQLHERALKIDEAAFGPDHPSVARDINNLGLVLKDLGDLEGAKERLERALKIRRKFLGDDHPNTITVRKNLESLGDQAQ